MKRLQIATVMGIFCAFAFCGCKADRVVDEEGDRIIMMEGSISIENLCDISVYPVVHAGYPEDFGVVTPGDCAMVGFVSFGVGGTARVTWAEGDLDAREREVVFPLRITHLIASKTKHLEFCYKGGEKWVLNLFGTSAREDKDLLVSIPGQVGGR
jgi:hypothetical protein